MNQESSLLHFDFFNVRTWSSATLSVERFHWALKKQLHIALKTRLENGSSCCSQANLGTATNFSSIAKPGSIDGIPLILMELELGSRIAKDLATAVFKPPRDRIDE